MNAIENRLAKLESAQRTAAVQPWRWIELRSVGDDQWRDPDGHIGSKDDLAARAAEHTILVFLEGGDRAKDLHIPS